MPLEENWMFDQCPILSVSEEEVTREASDMGLTREKYVEDLLLAFTISEGREGGGRRGSDKEEYSFDLTPDHQHLSYQKTCSNSSVRKSVK